jgi:hypothetical protein
MQLLYMVVSFSMASRGSFFNKMGLMESGPGAFRFFKYLMCAAISSVWICSVRD